MYLFFNGSAEILIYPLFSNISLILCGLFSLVCFIIVKRELADGQTFTTKSLVIYTILLITIWVFHFIINPLIIILMFSPIRIPNAFDYLGIFCFYSSGIVSLIIIYFILKRSYGLHLKEMAFIPLLLISTSVPILFIPEFYISLLITALIYTGVFMGGGLHLLKKSFTFSQKYIFQESN